MVQTPAANRLAGETSPYLLQHAHNPVDWYPWGPDAFERARREDKPVFLSVGYAACHWCHVMAHESFEDEKIAALMNRLFVNVKVDREERPDVDEIYMTAVQLMTGQGGWPMSVWLTPDGKPFFAGTYFPPDERFGRPGFARVCEAVAAFYRDQKDRAVGTGGQIIQAFGEMEAGIGAGGKLGESAIDKAVAVLDRSFDDRDGGFGGAPKFPPSMSLDLLMRVYHRTRRARLLEMVERTLEKMAHGGMYDQLGGGFHRYSVDAHWLVPHFEKMLYDNALLAGVYLDAWQLTRRPLYRRIVVETLDYVLREMADPAGGLYSSQDADSEGVEGKFYVWTPAEIRGVLGSDADAELFGRIYDVTQRGNFEHGTSILHLSRPLEISARMDGLDVQELSGRLDDMKGRLLAARTKRVPPGRDDKVLTSWNGLMIVSLARAGAVLGERRYLDAAVAAAEFILRELGRDGRLLRSWRAGQAKIGGYLDDYANFTAALIGLFEATFQRRWLDQADRFARTMIEHFRDPATGAFFYTADDAETLIARTKNVHDSATPSGNSVAAGALLRLGRWLDSSEYLNHAREVVGAMADGASRNPMAFVRLITVADEMLHESTEIAIVGPGGQRDPLLAEVRQRYLPNALVLSAEPGESQLAGLPLVAGRTGLDGRAAAYVCRNYTCEKPVSSREELAAALDAGRA